MLTCFFINIFLTLILSFYDMLKLTYNNKVILCLKENKQNWRFLMFSEIKKLNGIRLILVSGVWKLKYIRLIWAVGLKL